MTLELEQIKTSELNPGNELLQSFMWARFKEKFGWRAHAFRLKFNFSESTFLCLSRKIIGGCFIYVPNAGMELKNPGQGIEFLETVGTKIIQTVSQETKSSPVCVRFDLLWESFMFRHLMDQSKKNRVRKAISDIQPANTVLVNLAGADEEILARMKSKTRYNIRLSNRRNVCVNIENTEEAQSRNLSLWYGLYMETAERHSISAHSFEYFLSLFKSVNNYYSFQGNEHKPQVFLITAKYQDELLAGIILSSCGKMARYLYGASSLKHRDLMPNYLLQWKAICLARELGCQEYDLYGIPPKNDPKHPWYGLYRLKTGFGGKIIERVGCWDVFTNKRKYDVFRKMELIRQTYFKKIRPILVRKKFLFKR